MDPNSATAQKELWVMDLSLPSAGRRWSELPPLPGAARMMPVVAAGGLDLYVMGGIEIVPGALGAPKFLAPYLSDAYRFGPLSGGKPSGWVRLAGLPHPVAASPAPAWTADGKSILIFGGVDGTVEAVPVAERDSVRSLPNDILSYDVASGQWSQAGTMPLGTNRVNGPGVAWRGGYALVSGEPLPGRRTPSVPFVKLADSDASAD